MAVVRGVCLVIRTEGPHLPTKTREYHTEPGHMGRAKSRGQPTALGGDQKWVRTGAGASDQVMLASRLPRGPSSLCCDSALGPSATRSPLHSVSSLPVCSHDAAWGFSPLEVLRVTLIHPAGHSVQQPPALLQQRGWSDGRARKEPPVCMVPVLVSCCCCGSLPHASWLKQQKFLVSTPVL